MGNRDCRFNAYRCLRCCLAIRGVTQRDRFRNENIRMEVQVCSVAEKIQEAWLCWLWHMQRINEGDVVLTVCQEKMEGKRHWGSDGWIVSKNMESKWTLLPPQTDEDGGCLYNDLTPVDRIRERTREKFSLLRWNFLNHNEELVYVSGEQYYDHRFIFRSSKPTFEVY